MAFSVFDIFCLPEFVIIEDFAGKGQFFFLRLSRSFFACFLTRLVLKSHSTMSRRRRGLLFLGIFVTFLFATLFVHFFHTEKGLRPDGSCPACHFQTSSLAVGLSLAVNLPRLLFVEILPAWESHLESQTISFDLVSRSPPSA
jgi:hypothetical protein